MTAPEFGPVSNFAVTAWPSRGSTAFPQEVRPGGYGLVLRLGPVDIVIVQAPLPDGSVEFVRWCRQVARAAGQVAAEVENAARAPRHYARGEYGHGEQISGGDQDGDWPTG
jgi:hypothetical protein